MITFKVALLKHDQNLSPNHKLKKKLKLKLNTVVVNIKLATFLLTGRLVPQTCVEILIKILPH